jgi:uncharacterized protein YndB with AHSA1/START domain
VHRPATAPSAQSRAVPEEVWKLLYDPARFLERWAGIGTVDVERQGAYTMYPHGYPDFPTAQIAANATSGPARHRLVHGLRPAIEWRLEPSGAGTQITVEVEIPEREAQRLDSQREKISASLTRLAGLAAAS